MRVYRITTNGHRFRIEEHFNIKGFFRGRFGWEDTGWETGTLKDAERLLARKREHDEHVKQLHAWIPVEPTGKLPTIPVDVVTPTVKPPKHPPRNTKSSVRRSNPE